MALLSLGVLLLSFGVTPLLHCVVLLSRGVALGLQNGLSLAKVTAKIAAAEHEIVNSLVKRGWAGMSTVRVVLISP